MSINKNILLRLIEEEVNRAIFEQEEQPDKQEPEEMEPMGGDTNDSEPSLDSSDIDTEINLGADDEGQSGSSDLGGGEFDVDEEDSNASGGGFGGGGGGFGGGFSGGGGGFGDDGELGLTPDQEEEEPLATTVGPEDVEIPSDPIGAITDGAIKMLGQTRQSQQILRNVKSQIQRYFSDFEDATPIIKSLWDTEDIVLQDVARRLLLFIRGI